MLKKLRKKKTAKRVWIILAILIVPAFVFWGLGSAIRSPKESAYIGKIFGKKVSTLEYQDALAAVKNQFIMQLGDDFYQLEKHLNLPGLTWDRLILVYEAKMRKIHVSDPEVIELIESYPFFQRHGKFDKRIYEQTLMYFFHTQPRIFEEQTRQNLMLSRLYQQVTESLNLSEGEIKNEYQKLNEEISVHYIAGIPADFVKDITPTEAELKDYFTQNSLQFKQPLSFNIEYITFDLSDNIDEKVTQDKIRRFLAHLKNPQDFIKVAKEYRLEVKETGWFSQTDPIPGIGWSQELQNSLARLKVDQISRAIQTDKYYYILRLKEKKEPYIPDLETIKDNVKETFVKDRTKKIARERIENCLKELKENYLLNPKSIDFNKCAKAHRLRVDSTAPFKYGSYIEGIGASDNFWTVALGLKEDAFSEVLSLPSGFYIIKLKARTPVDEKKFEVEKAEFTKKLLAKTKEEYFNKFLTELKNKALALDIRLP